MVGHAEELRFLLYQEELLGAQDTSRPRDSDPPDELLSRDVEVLHGEESDQCACSPKSSLAMDGYGSWVRLGEVPLADVQEVFYYILWRVRAIYEKEVIVRDGLRDEFLPVVFGLIQADDALDVPLAEDLSVLLGGEAAALTWLAAIDWTHKCCELAWDDPVDVSVINSLVVFVLLDIEGLEVVPVVLDALVQPLQAVQYRALVVAVALGSIAEGDEVLLVLSEHLECFKGVLLQHDDHEGTHEEGRIGQLVGLVAAVVEYAIVLVLLILYTHVYKSQLAFPTQMGFCGKLTCKRRASSRVYLCTMARLRGPKSWLKGM